VSALALTTSLGTASLASGADEPESTPVAYDLIEGEEYAYVVNVIQGGAFRTDADAGAAAESAPPKGNNGGNNGGTNNGNGNGKGNNGGTNNGNANGLANGQAKGLANNESHNATLDAQAMDAAAAAIVAAGGVVVQPWPQIGVIVAHSTNANFEADLLANEVGNSIVSVGLTRADVPVTVGSDSSQTIYGAPFALGVGLVNDTNWERDTTHQWDMKLISADQAEVVNPGSPDVVVGIMDTGIAADHPDFFRADGTSVVDQSKSVSCVNNGVPDTSLGASYPTATAAALNAGNYHGTHVAGTVAAQPNDIGVVGVAPGVTLAAIKVGDDDGYFYPEYVICGFIWSAEHGIDVTNHSYYSDPFLYWCADQPDQAAVIDAVNKAMDYATANGVTHVAAAGNEKTDLATNILDTVSPNNWPDIGKASPRRTINTGCDTLPTGNPSVIVVSSITSTQALSSFSNSGLGEIDVAAPGSSIYSAIVTRSAATGIVSYTVQAISGTSMASPHVAGVAALVKSAHPEYTPAQVKAAVMAQATDHDFLAPQAGSSVQGGVPGVGANNTGTGNNLPFYGDAANNSFYGEGIANALKAVTE
jgi:subtilisin family serine protease